MKVWDLRSRKSLMTCKGHSKPVTSVEISQDGRVVASGSADSYVKIWENTSGRCMHQLRQTAAGVTAISMNPKDMACAVAQSDRHIRYWDLDIGNLVSLDY